MIGVRVSVVKVRDEGEQSKRHECWEVQKQGTVPHQFVWRYAEVAGRSQHACTPYLGSCPQ